MIGEDGEGNVGDLDWQDCKRCQHYRPDEGGCVPLDEAGESILNFDIFLDIVTCDAFIANAPDQATGCPPAIESKGPGGYSPCGGCSPESTSDYAACDGCRFNPHTPNARGDSLPPRKDTNA